MKAKRKIEAGSAVTLQNGQRVTFLSYSGDFKAKVLRNGDVEFIEAADVLEGKITPPGKRSLVISVRDESGVELTSRSIEVESWHDKLVFSSGASGLRTVEQCGAVELK